MKETLAKPALRISHIVYGRMAVKNRVHYLIDPKGKGSEHAVPESVVLKRWRKRQFPNHTFSGARLSSRPQVINKACKVSALGSER